MLLIVLCGRQGTGKTTLSRAVARELGACCVRVDAIETALARCGVQVGIEGYVVAHEVAATNLLLGLDVVLDAVNPVSEARVAWADTARRAGADLVLVETVLPDPVEHRRRVEQRLPDLPGQVVPSWPEVAASSWQPWDEGRDGVRLAVDTTDANRALHTLLDVCSAARAQHSPPDPGDQPARD